MPSARLSCIWSRTALETLRCPAEILHKGNARICLRIANFLAEDLRGAHKFCKAIGLFTGHQQAVDRFDFGIVLHRIRQEPPRGMRFVPGLAHQAVETATTSQCKTNIEVRSVACPHPCVPQHVLVHVPVDLSPRQHSRVSQSGLDHRRLPVQIHLIREFAHPNEPLNDPRATLSQAADTATLLEISSLILQSCRELPQNRPDLHLVHAFSAVSLEAEHRPVPEQRSGCESLVGCHGVQGILEVVLVDLLGATLARLARGDPTAQAQE